MPLSVGTDESRISFDVIIEKDNDVVTRRLDSSSPRHAWTSIVLVENAKSWFRFGPLPKQIEGPVVAAVDNDDYLSRAGIFQDGADDLDQGWLPVERRNHHTDENVIWFHVYLARHVTQYYANWQSKEKWFDRSFPLLDTWTSSSHSSVPPSRIMSISGDSHKVVQHFLRCSLDDMTEKRSLASWGKEVQGGDPEMRTFSSMTRLRGQR